MKRTGQAMQFIAFLVLGACGATPDSPSEPERKSFSGPLVSRRIELPADDEQFPELVGALLNRNCLSCHSATMVLYQPQFSEAQWRTIVEKMRDAYKAPVADQDVIGIVRELVALNRTRNAPRLRHPLTRRSQLPSHSRYGPLLIPSRRGFR